MKKLISFIIIFLLIGIIHLNILKAEEDKTLVIELPSNDASSFQLYSALTLRQAISYDVFLSAGPNSTFKNKSGKEIIKVNLDSSNNYNVSYELLPGVTEEDCTFDITDEDRNILIDAFEEDILKNYNKVKIEVKNIEYKDFGDTYIIDFLKYSDIYDMSYIDSYIFPLFLLELNKFDYMKEVFDVKSKNGKDLVKFSSYIKFNIDNGEQFLSSTESKIANNLTQEDDVIIELTTQIKNSLRSNSINVDDYSRLILKFSNTEYTSESDYVVDFTSINDDNIETKYKVFNLDAIRNHFMVNMKVEIENKEHKKLFYLKTLNNLSSDFYKIIPSEDLKYEDNLYIEFNDKEKESLLKYYGISTTNKLIFKFADPEFIEGSNQAFNTKLDNGLKFRLDIDYDKFIESGKVYIDNELVDPKNYEVSSGSTIITFKDDYVESLGIDEHNIKVLVSDGEANTTFKLSNSILDIVNPKTGDNTLIVMLSMIIIMMVLLFVNKKLEKNMVKL